MQWSLVYMAVGRYQHDHQLSLMVQKAGRLKCGSHKKYVGSCKLLGMFYFGGCWSIPCVYYTILYNSWGMYIIFHSSNITFKTYIRGKLQRHSDFFAPAPCNSHWQSVCFAEDLRGFGWLPPPSHLYFCVAYLLIW